MAQDSARPVGAGVQNRANRGRDVGRRRWPVVARAVAAARGRPPVAQVREALWRSSCPGLVQPGSAAVPGVTLRAGSPK